MTAANLLEGSDNVLVISTGIFGDWFGECIEVYNKSGTVDYLNCDFGSVTDMEKIEHAIKSKEYKLVTITQVIIIIDPTFITSMILHFFIYFDINKSNVHFSLMVPGGHVIWCFNGCKGYCNDDPSSISSNFDCY